MVKHQNKIDKKQYFIIPSSIFGTTTGDTCRFLDERCNIGILFGVDFKCRVSSPKCSQVDNCMKFK